MSFDIKKLNPEVTAEAGYEFNLTLPDGTETDAKFKVRGDNSGAVKAHGRRVFKEVEAQKAQKKRRGQADELTLDELTEMTIDAACVRVISFSGIQEDGVDVPCNAETIRDLMTKYDFARTQVLEAASNAFNFRSK